MAAGTRISPALAAPPCTMTWTGAANDGKWETPSNWTPPGPPGISDYACIPALAATVVTLSSTATLLGVDEQSQGLVVRAGLSLTDPAQTSTLNNVTLSGSLGSEGTLTLTGNATWTNGSLFGNHGAVDLGGGSLEIRNGNSPGQIDTGSYGTSPGQGSIFFESGTRNFAGVNIDGGDETGTGVYLTGGTLTGTISLLGNMY